MTIYSFDVPLSQFWTSLLFHVWFLLLLLGLHTVMASSKYPTELSHLSQVWLDATSSGRSPLVTISKIDLSSSLYTLTLHCLSFFLIHFTTWHRIGHLLKTLSLLIRCKHHENCLSFWDSKCTIFIELMNPCYGNEKCKIIRRIDIFGKKPKIICFIILHDD